MKQWHLLAIAGIIGLGVLFAPLAESAIPPTRAWLRILTDTGNVTANSYAANLTMTGDGITITPFFTNNTLRFTSGVSSLAMEDLTNVTDSGCAVGQARTVNASGWYVCSNVGTGDITGAANVGAGTGTVFRDEVAGTLNFKTIKEGANISITNNADDITITAAAGASGYTKINNLDGGTAKILATNITNQATVKTLTAGTGITITNGSKTITIDATGTGGFTSINNMAGGTAKILATNASSKANFKSLTAGSGISITNSSTTITIATSGGSGFTELNSINGGNARLLKSNSTNEGVFKSLTCTGVTSCTNGTDTITIRSEVNTMNGGTARIIKSNSTNGEVVFKSLTAGSNISITNGTDTITIASTGGSGTAPIVNKRWGTFIPNSATALGHGILGTTASLDGTETLAYNTTRGLLSIRSATGTTASANAGISQVTANFNLFRGDQNSYLRIEAAPAANVQGSTTRTFIGFQSGATQLPNAADTIVNALSAAGICKRTTDTAWQICTNDGAGAGTYATTGVTADTDWHVFEVYTTDSGVNWCVKIDSGTETCNNSDRPATTTRLYFNANTETTGAPSKNFIYGYVYLQNDR